MSDRYSDANSPPIERYHQEHDTRYVLCAFDGTELTDVLEDRVESMTLTCIGTGCYIKKVAVPLNSIPPVWTPRSNG